MKRFGRFFGTLALLGGLAFTGVTTHAATSVVVPNNLVNSEGLQDNGVPYNIGIPQINRTQIHYQQIYAASQFSTITQPMYIISIAYRPDCLRGAAFNTVLSNIEISLSTTTKSPDGLDSTFANNLGPDNTVVRSGSLALSSAFSGPVSGPKSFDIIIPLTTPFLYDPAKGNLIMDVKNFGGGLTTQFDADALSTSISRAFNTDNTIANTAANPYGLDTHGLVTQFCFVAVPNPAAAWSGLGLIGLLVAKRFRGRQA